MFVLIFKNNFYHPKNIFEDLTLIPSLKEWDSLLLSKISLFRKILFFGISQL